jgi:hypothetical protein
MSNKYMSTKDNIKKRQKRSGGYVAVITAVIVTLILALISMVTSNTTFLGRSDTTRLESKAMSRLIAEGCLDHARLLLALGPYLGNQTVSIDTFTCQLDTIVTSGTNKIINASATVDNKTTRLELTIDSTALTTVSLKEKSN